MYEGKPSLPPQKDDLERLYNLIVDNFCLTVLEFGCGYSTLVIEQALKENKRKWDTLENKPEVRNPNMFECHSIDTNEKWIAECESYSDIFFWCFDSKRFEYNGKLCHVYDNLPSILPDFIYIDGPDPLSVYDWGYNMPMAADLLLMEPLLIPGTIVLIDGRTNNARFLENNLQRNWKFRWDKEEDYTLMILEEVRLGKINAIGRDILEYINDNFKS